MKRLFRRLKRWQAILLICVLAAVVGWGGYTIWQGLGDGDAAGVGATERLIPVRYDNLLSEVSIDGSITFSNKKDLSFGAAGFVDEIMVSEGEIVSEGQSLARLNPESVAGLQHEVADARLGYQDALDALADAKEPTLQIAEAEAAKAETALAVQNAQKALDDLLKPQAHMIAEAESALADARLEQKQAQDALDTLISPKSHEVAAAEQAVAAAQVALQESADARGDVYSDAATAHIIAEQELAAANERLKTARNTSQIKDVQDRFNDAEEVYFNIVKKWTGAEANAEELALAPDALFQAIGFDAEEVYSNRYDLFTNGQIADNPATRWNELTIYGWRQLYPGFSEVEVRCDQATLLAEKVSDATNTNAELCIHRDMDNAYESLESVRNEMDSALSRYEESVVNAEVGAAQAEIALADAKKTLDRLESGSINNVLLEKEFAAARENLEEARQRLDELVNADDVETTSRRNQLALAEARSEKAAEDLDALINPDAAEVSSLRAQLAVEEARMEKAARDLEKLNERRNLEVELHEAALVMAQAKVDGALRRYEDSTLKAPWDGYISDIMVETDEEVEAFTSIVQVINSGIVEMEGAIDEIDVLLVERGAAAEITMDALPDQLLEGVVSNISSTATNQQGLVTFDVQIQVSLPPDSTLQEGLSAVARIVIDEQAGLIVPNQAIHEIANAPYVRMMGDDGTVVEQPIRLGSSDDFWTIVDEGLEEGDQILMEVLEGDQGGLFNFDDGGEDQPQRRPAPGRRVGGPPRN